MSEWALAIKQHYQSNWGQPGETCDFKVPVRREKELPEDFQVRQYGPTSERPEWTYATVGMSQPSDQIGLELHVFSETQSTEVVELLHFTAHFHRTGARLGLGHSVNLGRPWVRGSKCSFGLISLPYADGPRLENGFIQLKPVSFLWLIPITRAEREFKRTHGLEALEQRFEAASFYPPDPKRRSVV
jgi:hypothetical protein